MSQGTVFGALPGRQLAWVREQLHNETISGGLVLAAAALAMVWANSPWASSYETFVSTVVGPTTGHFDMTVAEWASSGLLAVFFFVVGLELKHELVLGSLAHPAKAAVPIAAAIGGMIAPAALYLIVNSTMPDGSSRGWGIPMATDIAFALAVLAIAGRHLPVALRAFLLTLAVVDDLGAITVIAVFYTDHVSLAWLGAAIACFIAYAYGQRRRWTSPWFFLPIALLSWAFVHESGIHATIAGVVLGLLTRVRPDPGEVEAPADRLQHVVHPISAGICVPLFALTAAGVTIGGTDIGDALRHPITIGIAVGLIVGKPLGITLTAWLVARFTRASLPSTLNWADVTAIGTLAGVGFTVALLIAELAYAGSPSLGAAKLAVLTASVLAGLLGAMTLVARGRHHAAIAPLDEDR